VIPLLDESMENLTLDVVVDEERFRGDSILHRIFKFSNANERKRDTDSNKQLLPPTV
jgi:hypothetical protein